MYLKNNVGKSIVAERFIGTLKNCKYMTSVLKNGYINNLVNNSNNIYRTQLK